MSNGNTISGQVREEVRHLIAELTEREPGEITDTALFVDDFGIDSLMAIEILVSLDKMYKIDIPEAEFHKINTVNDAVDAVMRHLSRKTTAG